MTKIIPTGEFDPNKHVREYKRTCNECGKVWHSLASREERIKKDASCSEYASLFYTCWSNDLSSRMDARKHEDKARAQRSLLYVLRRCPNCGSENYTEEVIIYEKK